MLRLIAISIVSTLLGTTAVLASDGRIQTRDAFIQLVTNRDLTRTGITLRVMPDGRISGRAFGRQVTGDWSWDGGFFCRSMFFGNQEIRLNCQLVERRGNALRFTADRGAGDSADLRLR